VTGDLLAHCLDTAIWINGSISTLTAMTETFIKERKHALTGEVQKVGIDDASAVLTGFENGSLGTFESTRYARGHKAALYARNQWGEGLVELGSARPATACSISTMGSKGPCAAGRIDTRHRRRPSLSSASGGCRACIIGYRALVHAPGGGFPLRLARREAGGADLPRRARNQPGMRCHPRFGQIRAWVTDIGASQVVVVRLALHEDRSCARAAFAVRLSN